MAETIMDRTHGGRMVVLVLLAALALPGHVRAGSPLPPWRDKGHDCPRPAYCPLIYWTPTLWRLYREWKGPRAATYAPDRYPALPPGYDVQQFPCPPVNPADLPYGAPSTPR
jgi:hypothetical protein